MSGRDSAGEREGQTMCVCVCVCARMYVCTCVCVCVCVCVCASVLTRHRCQHESPHISRTAHSVSLAVRHTLAPRDVQLSLTGVVLVSGALHDTHTHTHTVASTYMAQMHAMHARPASTGVRVPMGYVPMQSMPDSACRGTHTYLQCPARLTGCCKRLVEPSDGVCEPCQQRHCLVCVAGAQHSEPIHLVTLCHCLDGLDFIG